MLSHRRSWSWRTPWVSFRYHFGDAKTLFLGECLPTGSYDPYECEGVYPCFIFFLLLFVASFRSVHVFVLHA